MKKKQFNELLASVKEMDEMITRTDWKRLVQMTDKEIDTDDIAELDDDVFRDARFRMAY